MNWQEMDAATLWPTTLYALEHDGALLVVSGKAGKANPMTIGWAVMGNIWGRRILTVLVRPSRYTYGLMEEASDFTVCVLPADRSAALKLCGTRSGRDLDKLVACGLTTVAARRTLSPVLQEAVVVYECRIVHRNDVVPEALEGTVRESCYPKGDFHRLYYGEILTAYAAPEAAEQVRGR